MTTAVLNIKIGKVESKIPNHDGYISTQEYNKVATENFKERLR